MSWHERIAAATGSRVVTSAPLAGGSLGGATRLDLADGRTIVAKEGPLAGREAWMLRAIGATGVRVPEVFHADDDLLLMEFVAGGRPDEDGWIDLAGQLALLHTPGEGPYGWDADYAFAEVAMASTPDDDWPRFWGEHRLACHASHVAPAIARRLEALAARTGALLPAAPPAALLHGDLWGGNILFAGGRLAALIDPACYRGDREVDIAMLTLFDHPPEAFFEACDLADGWRDRLPAYRLWPLLVHLRLFGSAYRAPVERALDACGV